MTHTKAMEVKYLGATNTKGSRVIIKDMQFNTKMILNYDYSIGDILIQSVESLKSNGYTVSSYSSNYNDTYSIMVEAIDYTFKNSKGLKRV